MANFVEAHLTGDPEFLVRSQNGEQLLLIPVSIQDGAPQVLAFSKADCTKIWGYLKLLEADHPSLVGKQ